MIPVLRAGRMVAILACITFVLVACKPPAPEGQVDAPVFSPAEGSYETVLHVAMSSLTEGVHIRYTLDASTPSSSYGREYDGTPVEVTNTTTIKAIAYRDGWLDSTVSSAVFTLAGAAAAPLFSPEPGTFDSVPQLVTMATSTTGAVIRYTIDGSTPSAEYGTEYGGSPVVLESTSTLKAVASKPGLAASPISSGEYILSGTAATPTFSPGGGTFTVTQYVAISTATPGALIRYTVDGSQPTPEYGTVYAGTPVTLAVTRTLRAVAYLDGLESSMVASADYVIQAAAGNPYFTPAAGTYPVGLTVAIASVTEGVSIRYTLDGSTPTSSYGTLYSEAIAVTTNVTVRAIAFGPGLRDSGVASATYTIAGTVATPTYTPPQGAYWAGQTVVIKTTTDGASIVYTVDGTTPSPANGILYTGPIAVPSTTTIRSFANKTGWTDSAVATAAYSVAVDSGGNVGQWTSIATTGSTVYVAYYDVSNLDLKLASSANGGATWSIQRVDSVGSVGQHTSLAAVGPVLHLSYWDSVNQDLRYARSADGGVTWWRTLVDATGNTGQYSSVGASGSDVYISYYDITNGDLRVATSTDNGVTWSTVLRDGTGNTGQWTSLVVEGTTLLLLYQDVTAQDLRFTRYFGGLWSAPVAWDTGPVGQYVSARLDPVSWTLFVVYYDVTNGDLKLAKSVSSDSGDTWPAPAISVVDSAGFVGSWASLALTGGDDLTVSYLLDFTYDLKVARSLDGGSTWSLVTVDTNGVGQYTSAADNGTELFVSYYDIVNLDLKVARSVDGGASWERY